MSINELKTAFALMCAVALAGCASSAAMPNSRYDLGASLVSSQSANAQPMPPVKVLAVSAPRNLETDALGYRLSYVDAQRIGNYSNSHWTMPPAQLLTQRLREALAARGPVLSGADPVRAVPLLEVDLTNFEQVFDAPGQSHGLVSVRTTLTRDGRVVSQRSFTASTPAPTGDAAGGAHALAAASDDVIAQLAAWLAAQPLTATR
ncbi:putative lipoprotein [Candidatus Burkholderia pumila]|uniref:Lipoprotein n=1 Tax=Candidatus Burkholderia pumila TaxID=1090375 RepID=A0ABR5HKK2_9BURK|nr:putative lipoprotein [Candidatus Burkholderia pumila]